MPQRHLHRTLLLSKLSSCRNSYQIMYEWRKRARWMLHASLHVDFGGGGCSAVWQPV